MLLSVPNTYWMIRL